MQLRFGEFWILRPEPIFDLRASWYALQAFSYSVQEIEFHQV
jgi:hypothetical protein